MNGNDFPRYSRERFDRDRRDAWLTEVTEVLWGTEPPAPASTAELAELERLIRKHPAQAQRLLDSLTGSSPDVAERNEGDL